MNQYKIQHDIKKRYKKAGLTVRDLANALGEAPGTTSNRLNAWVPITENHKRIIDKLIRKAEKKQSSANKKNRNNNN